MFSVIIYFDSNKNITKNHLLNITPHDMTLSYYRLSNTNYLKELLKE